jgi:ABC-type polysaccharide/polyol phosphate transport system ATPase subunit
MSEDIVISVEQVSKSYRIWTDPASRLIAPALEGLAKVPPFTGWLRKKATAHYKDFQALRNVSLQVRKGEAIGIVGRNGSGKSTLLQIVSKTLQPTTGTARATGRVAALLELGSGFNPEFTGRENVFLNGAILGLSPHEMEERFPAIAEFADIGDFINQPVRTYSSGMVVRLAFAVAAHVDADILIVDEALSVGDARFQLKCARAIDRFISQGVTFLFVSHDASMVKRLCNRALLLDAGRVLYTGLPNDVINLYSKLMADGGTVESLAEDIAALQGTTPTRRPEVSAPATAAGTPATAGTVPLAESERNAEQLRLRVKALETVLQASRDFEQLARKADELWRNERRHVQVTGQEFAYGGELGRIHEVALFDADGQSRTWFNSCEPISVRMVVEAHDHFPEPIFAMTLKSSAGVEIYGTNTLFSRQPATALPPGVKREVRFCFDLNVVPGVYFISVGLTHFVGEELVVIHRRYDAIKLEVHGLDRTFGIANLRAKITAQDLTSAAPV